MMNLVCSKNRVPHQLRFVLKFHCDAGNDRIVLLWTRIGVSILNYTQDLVVKIMLRLDYVFSKIHCV